MRYGDPGPVQKTGMFVVCGALIDGLTADLAIVRVGERRCGDGGFFSEYAYEPVEVISWATGEPIPDFDWSKIPTDHEQTALDGKTLYVPLVWGWAETLEEAREFAKKRRAEIQKWLAGPVAAQQPAKEEAVPA